MIVTIHQPNFLPYAGFFHKLSLADTFVVLDNTQFQFDYTDRNKILKKDGSWTRISIPIKIHQKFFPIKNVEIDNEKDWREKNWNLLVSSYDDTEFFYLYKDYFKELFKKEWKYIFDINFDIIKKCIEWLDVKVDIVKESELNIDGQGSEKLVNICKKLGVKKYISGSGGKKYLDENLFDKNNIQVEFQHFFNKAYKQKSQTFVPNLSIIDLLSNLGPNSKTFLTQLS